jgi:hypothetical protein
VLGFIVLGLLYEMGKIKKSTKEGLDNDFNAKRDNLFDLHGKITGFQHLWFFWRDQKDCHALR